MLIRSLLCLVTILLLLSSTSIAAETSYRQTVACASMSADSNSGLSYGATVKATAANRVLRAPIVVADECLTYLELAGSTTAPGGPIFAAVYLMRSGAQSITTIGRVSIPEGKSGVYKVTFPEVCMQQGDAIFGVVNLNAGGGVPYETASCSYLAIGE